MVVNNCLIMITTSFFSLQHVVVEVVLGIKEVKRFKSSLKEFMTYASDNVSFSELNMQIKKYGWLAKQLTKLNFHEIVTIL